jgi:hypothetical protein
MVLEWSLCLIWLPSYSSLKTALLMHFQWDEQIIISLFTFCAFLQSHRMMTTEGHRLYQCLLYDSCSANCCNAGSDHSNWGINLADQNFCRNPIELWPLMHLFLVCHTDHETVSSLIPVQRLLPSDSHIITALWDFTPWLLTPSKRDMPIIIIGKDREGSSI